MEESLSSVLYSLIKKEVNTYLNSAESFVEI